MRKSKGGEKIEYLCAVYPQTHIIYDEPVHLRNCSQRGVSVFKLDKNKTRKKINKFKFQKKKDSVLFAGYGS
jgi:hypothetical protein